VSREKRSYFGRYRFLSNKASYERVGGVPLFRRNPPISPLNSHLLRTRVRGCLHLSDSASESRYDSVHDFYKKGLGGSINHGHQLQLFGNTFQEKLVED
jgi:hypothetical protein